MSEQDRSAEARIERTRRPMDTTNADELPGEAAAPLDARLGRVSTGSVDGQVAWLQRLPVAQQQRMVARIGRVQGNRHVQRLVAAIGQPPAGVTVQRATPDRPAPPGVKDSSARFGGDPPFERIAAGAEKLKPGSTGIPVVKLQQALNDLGFLPPLQVNGTFDAKTATSLKLFQASEGNLDITGELDKYTIKALNANFDTREPYVANATFDRRKPTKGTRTLSAGERRAVLEAMVPRRGVGGAPSVFKEEVDGKKYGDRIRAALTTVIAALHKELFADKKPLRADPARNFHPWSVLEKTAKASKDVTDAVYGTYAKGPRMTAAAGNFVDQWEDELTRNAALDEPEKKAKATEKVWYLIDSNLDAINRRHGAVPSDTAEKAILTPIVASFVDTPAKVQRLLELDIGWEGAQLEGVVYLQRFKQQGAGATAAERKRDADAKNRKQLWELFHVCIHEYIHSLAHPAYKAYAHSFYATDKTRYNTLIEGMDDFFTLNVRTTVVVNDALRKQVEGPFYDAAAAVPEVSVGVYPSHAQAEQVVSIVGIRNAAAAYFQGKTKLIGKPTTLADI